jgi:hypothetical protein
MWTIDYGSVDLSKARRANSVSSLNPTLFGALNTPEKRSAGKAEGELVSLLGDNGRGILFIARGNLARYLGVRVGWHCVAGPVASV